MSQRRLHRRLRRQTDKTKKIKKKCPKKKCGVKKTKRLRVKFVCQPWAKYVKKLQGHTHTGMLKWLSFLLGLWEMRTIYNRNCCVCIWITRRIRNQRAIAKSMTMTRRATTTTTMITTMTGWQVTHQQQQQMQNTKYKTNVIFYISIVFYDCAQSAHVPKKRKRQNCCSCLPAVNLKLCV